MLRKQLARREFLKVAGLGSVGALLPNGYGARRSLAPVPQEMLVYVGTYTAGKSVGIYRYRLNLSSGELTLTGETRGVVNPSYLTLARNRKHLYAVNEISEFAGKKSGAISSFAVNQTNGELRFLNQQSSLGGAPCYVTVSDDGRFVLAANYEGGSVAVLPVRGDGSLGAASDVRQYQGSGPNPARQEAPHAHCIVLDNTNRYAYSCDLGTDRVMIFRFDARNGKLLPNEQAYAQTKAGAGPRHITFHPNNKFAYVINELNATVTAFAHNEANGSLNEVQTVRALPENFKGANTSADIHVSPNGKFLYCSNRGHNSIAAFSINAQTGKLALTGYEPTRGKTPRNFAIDPTGTFLLVANQESDSIATSRLDPQTGKLDFTGHVVAVPSPVCLKIIAPFA
jgi:6-phosphogluconolactonase